MNLSITFPNGTVKTAQMIPGTLKMSDTLLETAADFSTSVRMASAVTGSCSLYASSGFTVSDAISLADRTGQGSIVLGAPVGLDHAVVSVALRGNPPQVFLTFSGTEA